MAWLSKDTGLSASTPEGPRIITFGCLHSAAVDQSGPVPTTTSVSPCLMLRRSIEHRILLVRVLPVHLDPLVDDADSASSPIPAADITHGQGAKETMRKGTSEAAGTEAVSLTALDTLRLRGS
jgi:hypothetical protein